MLTVLLERPQKTKTSKELSSNQLNNHLGIQVFVSAFSLSQLVLIPWDVFNNATQIFGLLLLILLGQRHTVLAVRTMVSDTLSSLRRYTIQRQFAQAQLVT